MEFEHEQRQARRILAGIEDGTMNAAQSWALIERADPTLVYLIFTWLRANYANHPAAQGVLGRILGILDAHPKAATMLKEGEQDSIVEWFDSTYDYRSLKADEFVRIVVEKLEG